MRLNPQLPQGHVFHAGEDQAQRGYGHKSNQPEHDAAAGRQFLRCIKKGIEGLDGRQLRSAAYNRELQDSSRHAEGHEDDCVDERHCVYGFIGVGLKHGVVCAGDHQPHGQRQHANPDKGTHIVDGVQSGAEDSDFRGEAMGQMWLVVELALHPQRDLFPLAPYADGNKQQGEDDKDQHRSQRSHDVVLLVGEGLEGSGE